MEGNKRVRRRRRNTVERLKNLLILLLTLSAVVLTVRVLMFNGLVGSSSLTFRSRTERSGRRPRGDRTGRSRRPARAYCCLRWGGPLCGSV